MERSSVARTLQNVDRTTICSVSATIYHILTIQPKATPYSGVRYASDCMNAKSSLVDSTPPFILFIKLRLLGY